MGVSVYSQRRTPSERSVADIAPKSRLIVVSDERIPIVSDDHDHSRGSSRIMVVVVLMLMLVAIALAMVIALN